MRNLPEGKGTHSSSARFVFYVLSQHHEIRTKIPAKWLRDLMI